MERFDLVGASGNRMTGCTFSDDGDGGATLIGFLNVFGGVAFASSAALGSAIAMGSASGSFSPMPPEPGCSSSSKPGGGVPGGVTL
jgi:hypothetical protein